MKKPSVTPETTKAYVFNNVEPADNEIVRLRAENKRLREVIELLEKDLFNLTEKVMPPMRKDAKQYRWLIDYATAPDLIRLSRLDKKEWKEYINEAMKDD